jgi:hypothetical protein
MRSFLADGQPIIRRESVHAAHCTGGEAAVTSLEVRRWPNAGAANAIAPAT